MANDFKETTFFDAPNFLALFAAIAYLKGYSPNSRTTDAVVALKGQGVNWERGLDNLSTIAREFDSYDPEADEESPYASFIAATKSTTHRISSRKTRFEQIVRAIAANAP